MLIDSETAVFVLCPSACTAASWLLCLDTIVFCTWKVEKEHKLRCSPVLLTPREFQQLL